MRLLWAGGDSAGVELTGRVVSSQRPVPPVGTRQAEGGMLVRLETALYRAVSRTGQDGVVWTHMPQHALTCWDEQRDSELISHHKIREERPTC